MAKSNQPTPRPVQQEQRKAQPAQTQRRVENERKPRTAMPLLFGRKNYAWAGIGLIIIVLGYVLMSGGRMTDPNVWDESKIYSFTRITLAPALVVVGLFVVAFSIFKKTDESDTEATGWKKWL